ncbi:hypothetical protein STEG23_008947 [Scotinomys teguina]
MNSRKNCLPVAWDSSSDPSYPQPVVVEHTGRGSHPPQLVPKPGTLRGAEEDSELDTRRGTFPRDEEKSSEEESSLEDLEDSSSSESSLDPDDEEDLEEAAAEYEEERYGRRRPPPYNISTRGNAEPMAPSGPHAPSASPLYQHTGGVSYLVFVQICVTEENSRKMAFDTSGITHFKKLNRIADFNATSSSRRGHLSPGTGVTEGGRRIVAEVDEAKTLHERVGIV